ncbi:MAG TPA: aminotransferase class IV, partial [Pseudothermotoga sp.]
MSIDEPGVLYGGIPYETLRTYQKKLFAGKFHYDRLSISASYLGMKIPVNYECFREIILQGINSFDNDVSIRILLLPRGEISAFRYEPYDNELVIYMDYLRTSPIEGKVKVK